MSDTTAEQCRAKKVEASRYFRFLEFAIEKALPNEEFTIEEAKMYFPDANDKEITNRLLNVCHHRLENVDRYQIKPEAFLSYLAFLALRDSQKTAAKADSRAVTAIRIAIATLLLSIVFSVLGLTVPSTPMKLAASQLEALKVKEYVKSVQTAIENAALKGSAERSEITRQLSAPHQIDNAQMQELIAAVRQPNKLDETQWKELYAVIRELSNNRTDSVPRNAEPETTE